MIRCLSKASGMLALVLALAVTAASAQGPAVSPVGIAVAETYGLADWPRVARLRFTFVIRDTQRHWDWDVANDRVTLTAGDDEPITFTPYAPTTEAERRADRRFINDTYWLLFPFQLVWSDPEITVEDDGVTLPLGGDAATRKIVAAFPSEGGYTPGDTYELFYAADEADPFVDQWRYTSADGERSLATTWKDHVRLGPLALPTRFRNDGGFDLRFTNLSATLADGTTVAPEPVESISTDTP